MFKTATFVCLILVVASAANAATVVLRSAAMARGPVLTLGDVADIHSGDPSEVVALTTTPLGPAPQTRLFLRASEIRDRLAARGIDLRGIQFRGAGTVEVGKTVRHAADQLIPAKRPPDAELIAADVRRAIGDYLALQTGHEHWEITLLAGNANLDQLAGANADVQIRGGTTPWTGRQTFQVRRAGVSQVLDIAARVVRVEMVVFATSPIPAGSLIRRSDVEMRPFGGVVSSQAVPSIDAAVGMEARRPIRADAMLSANNLRAPRLVNRGETVSVFARVGGVTVRKLAIAKQEGSLGDLVQVESGPNRERYAARVSGHRELEVYAIGNDARDLALRRTNDEQK